MEHVLEILVSAYIMELVIRAKLFQGTKFFGAIFMLTGSSIKMGWHNFGALKLRFETKSTTFKFGHFTTISGYFFANYMNFFHKT